MYERIDDFGDKEYCKDITLKIRCVSYDTELLDYMNESSIFECLNNKGFDEIGYFEKIDEEEV